MLSLSPAGGGGRGGHGAAVPADGLPAGGGRAAVRGARGGALLRAAQLQVSAGRTSARI